MTYFIEIGEGVEALRSVFVVEWLSWICCGWANSENC